MTVPAAGNTNSFPYDMESLHHFWHRGGGVADLHEENLMRKKCSNICRHLLLHAVTMRRSFPTRFGRYMEKIMAHGAMCPPREVRKPRGMRSVTDVLFSFAMAIKITKEVISK